MLVEAVDICIQGVPNIMEMAETEIRMEAVEPEDIMELAEMVVSMEEAAEVIKVS